MEIQRQSRFITLDGMRGVAAILVMLFHVAKLYPIFCPSGAYLAVDMFFALSGFVIACANDKRFSLGLSWQEFLIRRVVRLYPLYLAGMIFGLFALMLTWHERNASFSHLIVGGVPNLALLPALAYFDRPRLFILNGPAWSLFCEFWVANLLYGVFWKRINRWSLSIIIGVSFAALVWTAFRHGMLDVGSLRSTIFGGIVRVAFSFAVGISLWRLYDRYGCRYAVPSWIILAILVLLLSLPIEEGPSRALFDVIAVAVIFPAMIYLGAGAKERRPEIGVIVGDLSYSLYIIHEPILLGWNAVFPATGNVVGVTVTGFLIVAIASAFLLDKFYDPPARGAIGLLLRPRVK